jgi:hypothetical protein
VLWQSTGIPLMVHLKWKSGEYGICEPHGAGFVWSPPLCALVLSFFSSQEELVTKLYQITGGKIEENKYGAATHSKDVPILIHSTLSFYICRALGAKHGRPFAYTKCVTKKILSNKITQTESLFVVIRRHIFHLKTLHLMWLLHFFLEYFAWEYKYALH